MFSVFLNTIWEEAWSYHSQQFYFILFYSSIGVNAALCESQKENCHPEHAWGRFMPILTSYHDLRHQTQWLKNVGWMILYVLMHCGV